MALLEINNLCKSFGGLSAVLNVNFKIEEHELVALIGPNGAGKTTMFNLITGVYKLNEGNIIFKEKEIQGLPPYNICKKGIARTFQNIRLFNDLTVLENVKIALHKDVPYSLVSAVLRLPSYYKGEQFIEEKALQLLELFNLDDKKMKSHQVCHMGNNED